MTKVQDMGVFPRADNQNTFHGENMEIADLPNDNEQASAVAQEAPKGAWHKRMLRINPVLSIALGWAVGLLVVLFLVFIVLGIMYSGIRYHGSEWHDCSSTCATPFGAILGAHNGVFAFSNCNDEFFVEEWNEVTWEKKERSGITWQCVEYARRYWMFKGEPVPALFGEVDGASDIWSLDSVQLKDGRKVPLLKYANGQSLNSGGSAPQVRDLLIYPKQGSDFPFGHVAVIVAVEKDFVLVAEQNWENKVWPAPHHNYSRKIPMQYSDNDKTYTINEDDGVIITGWVRYNVGGN